MLYLIIIIHMFFSPSADSAKPSSTEGIPASLASFDVGMRSSRAPRAISGAQKTSLQVS